MKNAWAVGWHGWYRDRKVKEEEKHSQPWWQCQRRWIYSERRRNREREKCAPERIRLKEGKKIREEDIRACEKRPCVCGAVIWRTSDVRSLGQLGGGFVSLSYCHLRFAMPYALSLSVSSATPSFLHCRENKSHHKDAHIISLHPHPSI